MEDVNIGALVEKERCNIEPIVRCCICKRSITLIVLDVESSSGIDQEFRISE